MRERKRERKRERERERKREREKDRKKESKQEKKEGRKEGRERKGGKERCLKKIKICKSNTKPEYRGWCLQEAERGHELIPHLGIVNQRHHVKSQSYF